MQQNDMSTATGEGPQVFICYDKTYQERALHLHGLLRTDLRGKFGRDIDVFIDRENLATGAEWDGQIKSALASARLLVVLISDGLITRPYCRFEFNTMGSRIAGGEKCYILAVKWQRDSEIYRSGALTQTQLDKLDRTYLASLADGERDMVIALRRLQFLDGASLREESPASDGFNTAFLALSTEVARLYRELRVTGSFEPLEASEAAGPAAASPAEATGAAFAIMATAPEAPAGPTEASPAARSTRRVPIWLIAGAVVTLAVVAVLAIPSLRAWIVAPGGEVTVQPSPPSAEPPLTETPPLQPDWQPVQRLVENRSGRDVVAYRDARIDAEPLEKLSPGVVRPIIGVMGPVEIADISGVTWLSYPTQVEGTRGFVRAADLDPP